MGVHVCLCEEGVVWSTQVGEQWRAPCLERNGWLSIGAAEEGGTERKTRAVKMTGAEATRGRGADGGAAG